ncbi:hypothetical protein Tco_1501473 [Tanacetum coccineum]
MIGGLMYLTASPPDIAFATFVSALCQARPTEKHLKKGAMMIAKVHLEAFNFRETSQSVGRLRSKIVQQCQLRKLSTYLYLHATRKSMLKKGTIELYFVGTECQLADLFTKALSRERFEYSVRRIGMRCMTPTELDCLAKLFS